MKYLFLCTLFCFFSSITLAQNFANTWIDASQTYIKMELEETGIYRLTSIDLQNAGYDLSQVNPDNFHLYFRGNEQRLFIKRDSAGQFSYLEFWGEKLDGGDDASLYRDAINGRRDTRVQTHPHRSLFSDTSAYFLTWDQNPSSLRFSEYVNTGYSSFTSVPHFRYESSVDFDPSNPSTRYINGAAGIYDPFYMLSSNYGIGEGFVGQEFTSGNPLGIDIPTELAANATNVEVKIRILGRSNAKYRTQVALNGDQNNPILDTSRVEAAPFVQSFVRNVNLTQQLPLSSRLDFFSLDRSSVSSHPVRASISYDRLPDLQGQSSISLSYDLSGSDAFFRFSQADGNNTVYMYDLSHGVRNEGLIGGGIARTIVKGFSDEADLYVFTDKKILKPRIVPNQLSDLSNSAGAELLIITHRTLASSAQAFATYRDTNQVNSLSSHIVFTDEIYDEFGYGSPTPLAIHRFCQYALENWQTPPEYVLLWGKGEGQIRNHSNNLVPTFGFPASDQYFLTPLDAVDQTDLVPETSIGRVSVKNNQEGLIYLNKVISYEHAADIGWLNQGVFLGGGSTLGEQRAIQDALRFTQTTFDASSPQKQSYLCMNSIRPTDTLCYSSIEIGVGLIHFFGPTTNNNVPDIALDEPSAYNNFGKFPLMIGMGGGGDFTQTTSFGEKWILEDDRGAIAYIGNSSFAYLNPLRDLGKILYPNLYITGDQRLGDAIHTSIIQYLDSLPGIQYINHALQFNLQGDPSLLWRGGQSLTGIDPNQPAISFKLFPNPATTQFVISYDLPKRGWVELRMLDIEGRKIDRYKKKMGAGFHEFEWNRPEGLSAGIYFVQIIYEGYVYSEKLMIRD